MLEAHGFYSVKREGNNLFCLLSGCWNEENVISYTNKVKELVNELPTNTPWFYIIDVLSFEGATPSAYKKESDFIYWCLENKLQHRIVISKDIFKVKIAKKYQDTFLQLPTTLVLTKQLAAHWLKENNIQNLNIAG